MKLLQPASRPAIVPRASTTCAPPVRPTSIIPANIGIPIPGAPTCPATVPPALSAAADR